MKKCDKMFPGKEKNCFATQNRRRALYFQSFRISFNMLVLFEEAKRDSEERTTVRNTGQWFDKMGEEDCSMTVIDMMH